MKISNIGTRVELELMQGSTFGPVTHTLKNPDGTPVDLTGCTPRGQIRRKASDPDVTAPLVCVVFEPATAGVYTFGLSAATTAAIPAGSSANDPNSNYDWDLELLDSQGRVIPLLWGTLKVQREVTRG